MAQKRHFVGNTAFVLQWFKSVGEAEIFLESLQEEIGKDLHKRKQMNWGENQKLTSLKFQRIINFKKLLGCMQCCSTGCMQCCSTGCETNLSARHEHILIVKKKYANEKFCIFFRLIMILST